MFRDQQKGVGRDFFFNTYTSSIYQCIGKEEAAVVEDFRASCRGWSTLIQLGTMGRDGLGHQWRHHLRGVCLHLHQMGGCRGRRRGLPPIRQ